METWHRYQVARPQGCNGADDAGWVYAADRATFDAVGQSVALLRLKARRGQDRSIRLSCEGDCDHPHERLHAFLRAPVRAVQRTSALLVAETAQDRLILWPARGGAIARMRIETMPPPPLS
jgi:hypothetical protein